MKMKRKYGCFEKRDEHWVNLFPTQSYKLDTARRVFQSHLLSGAFGGTERRLRPVSNTVV